MEDLKSTSIYVVILAAIGLLISFAIVYSLTELSFLLFDPFGRFFNSDTIPLQAEIILIFETLGNPFTYILTPVGMVIAHIGIRIYDS